MADQQPASLVDRLLCILPQIVLQEIYAWHATFTSEQTFPKQKAISLQHFVQKPKLQNKTQRPHASSLQTLT